MNGSVGVRVPEVYLIDESTLKAMDVLEGVHRGRYCRRESFVSRLVDNNSPCRTRIWGQGWDLEAR